MSVVAGTWGTPLHVAVAEGYKDVVSVLFEEGCPIGVKDSDVQCVLHLAAFLGQVDLIGLFVKCGLNVNAEDDNGWTPLHCAAASGNLEFVRKLLESGGKASMTVVAGTCGTPLHMAVAEGYKHIVSVLLEEGCPIGVKNSNGESVLHWAARFGQVDLIVQFTKCGLNVNAEDNDGWTPLHFAADNGNLKSVRKLLESGGKASMTVVAGTCGTPLHLAVAKGYKHIVSVLLEEGCPIGVKNSNGRSVLHWAAGFGQVDLIALFVKGGLNANAEDNDGWTPLHTAAANGKRKSVRRLLRLGTGQVSATVTSRIVPTQSINYAGKNGITPLLRAAMKLHVKTFMELKSHGGDIYLSDSFGLKFCDWCLLNQKKNDTINRFCKACGINCDDEDLVGIISSLCAKKLFDIDRVLCLAAKKGNVDVFDAMVASECSLDHQSLPKAGLILSFGRKNTEILNELHISSEPLNPLHIALLSVFIRKVYNHAFIEKLISHPRTRYTINEVFPNGLSPLDVARQLKLHNIADMIEGAGGGPGLWADLPKQIEQQCFYAYQAMRKLTGCESGHEAAVRILTVLGVQSHFVEGEQRDTTRKKILEEKPKIILIDRHILSNLKNKGKWRRVGGLLEVDNDTLNRLGEEFFDSDDAYYSMLEYWLKHGHNVSWKTLLDAVGHFETKKTVDDMTERIVKENTTSNSSSSQQLQLCPLRGQSPSPVPAPRPSLYPPPTVRGVQSTSIVKCTHHGLRIPTGRVDTKTSSKHLSTKQSPTVSVDTQRFQRDPNLTEDKLLRLVGKKMDARWEEFAEHLHVEWNMIKGVRRNCPFDVTLCFIEVTGRWLSGDDGTGERPRTWETVFDALRLTGYPLLVEDVKEALSKEQ